MRLPLHGPTVVGRLRTDRGLLVLTGLVVALATALLTAVAPLTVRTADLAMDQVVREAAPGGSVVATLPAPPFQDVRNRNPAAVESFDREVTDTQATMPERLEAAVRVGVASLTSASLPLLDVGPRTLRLAYLTTSDGPPEVEWTAGTAPQAGASGDDAAIDLPYEAPPWPVQVGLSEKAAAALEVGPGDRLTAEDQYGTPIDVRISGTYVATDPGDDVWRAAPELLQPAVGQVDGVERTAVAALVTPESLPDLEIAVPADQLTTRIVFAPIPERIRWQPAPQLRREIVELKAAPGISDGAISWDSLLDRVIDDGLGQVSTARGQAQVLLVGLVVTALLTLALAAQLLVRRRAGPLTLARERGATLGGIAAELAVESCAVAVAGAAVGLAVTAALVGSVGWGSAVPVVVGAVLASPLLGAAQAARATDARRVPANRAARRTLQRARRTRRLVLEVGVLALAALTFVALRQRGAVDGDLTPASATTWGALAGALVLVRVLPPVVRLALRGARRTTGRVRFLVLARVAEAGGRALPLVVVVVAVAQLVLGTALAATEQRGQEAGAYLSVGGDARLTTTADPALVETAAEVADADGVDTAVAGAVVDGVRASSRTDSERVRLVVVAAPDYRRLLARSDLPDAAQLGLLGAPASEDDPVSALLLGGTDALRDRLQVRLGDDSTVALDVVGEAPRVDAAIDPVIVVDSAGLAAAGASVEPDTVWAVGPGAAAALRAAARDDAGASVTTYDEVLAQRRDAPLASALVHLAFASALLLLVLAGLGIVLGAAAEARPRASALGRLRSLGLADRELRRVLTGELLTPVLASVVTGLALGAACAAVTFGSLGLEQVTGQSETPQLVVPWWILVAALALLAIALVVAAREGARLRRTSLARLLRSG